MKYVDIELIKYEELKDYIELSQSYSYHELKNLGDIDQVGNPINIYDKNKSCHTIQMIRCRKNGLHFKNLHKTIDTKYIRKLWLICENDICWLLHTPKAGIDFGVIETMFFQGIPVFKDRMKFLMLTTNINQIINE